MFHSPWIDGALLRSPVPMVVTLHDLVPLKRRGEYLRTGLRFKLRYLAVQRADAVIVPTRTRSPTTRSGVLEIPADRIEVIGEAAAPAFWTRGRAAEVEAVRERYGLPDHYLLWVGGCARPTRASGSRRSPGRRARCRSCSSGRPAAGRASSPT